MMWDSRRYFWSPVHSQTLLLSSRKEWSLIFQLKPKSAQLHLLPFHFQKDILGKSFPWIEQLIWCFFLSTALEDVFFWSAEWLRCTPGGECKWEREFKIRFFSDKFWACPKLYSASQDFQIIWSWSCWQ